MFWWTLANRRSGTSSFDATSRIGEIKITSVWFVIGNRCFMGNSNPASQVRLLNGSTGDPVLFVDYPGRDDAILFDAGENHALGSKSLSDLKAVFLTHHHIDHFVGFDRILRANLDRDKVLSVYGPIGTIDKLYRRITSYEHPFFPFQKLVIAAHEVDPEAGRLRRADLECEKRFPVPEVIEADWSGPVLFDAGEIRVEAAAVDHTVPCLSYALVERAGYHPNPDRLKAGPLRRGPWVGRVLDLLRDEAPPETEVDIDGGRFSLGRLADDYFLKTGGSRLAFVVDTAWTEEVRCRLLVLAGQAQRLYCDCFYAAAQAESAARHRHLTALQAAEFAREAQVEELILIHFAQRYRGQYLALLDEARTIFPNATAVFD